jgi:dephospho-CoA kinase
MSSTTEDGEMPDARKLIGLTGTNGAGKGEAAKFFREHGYAYFSLSDVLREELRSRSLEASRDNLIRTGNELREKFGADILARRVMARVTAGGAGRAVIDSIRNVGEINYFRAAGGFVLLAFDAPVEMRFNRVAARGRNESAGSLEEFRRKEDEERAGGETAQQIEACMSAADYLIVNDGTIEDLRRKLERFL